MGFEDSFIAKARVSSNPHKKIKLDDKLTFFTQLSTLVNSGTPLLQAINICSEQNQSLKLREVLRDIATAVAAGSTVNEAAAQHLNVFEHHWIGVIRTGEITGQMGSVLVELNKQIRESRDTRKKVIGSLMYPMILVCVAITAVTVLLWLVVPTFAKMFADMGAELPGMTQFVVDASGFIVKYGLYILVAIVAIAVAIRQYWKTERGRRQFLGVGIGLPMIGELIVMMAMYRFASNIALLLKSGIPMLETMSVLQGVFHQNPIYREAIEDAKAHVSAGRPLAVALEETALFTSMITNMVRIGEESGQLYQVMDTLTPFYKEKMEGLIAKVTKLLEPIIIAGMGVTIAALMLSIYMPMFEMAGKVN
ncbi:MAG TPA: type II secretion system F family protein [Pirellulales bacterium]|jgi:type IV pilus assembly protein PilC|nr:type II secretion system F family protein [Pirellulales bacterium]